MIGYLVRTSVRETSALNKRYPLPQIFERTAFIFLPIRFPVCGRRESRLRIYRYPKQNARHGLLITSARLPYSTDDSGRVQVHFLRRLMSRTTPELALLSTAH